MNYEPHYMKGKNVKAVCQIFDGTILLKEPFLCPFCNSPVHFPTVGLPYLTCKKTDCGFNNLDFRVELVRSDNQDSKLFTR